ncbi:hypothetical protein BDV59DRAFT_202217 [Aspergillus ambiguus]|uniref:DNA damage response protein RcaA n=1 Tax=Aspergillus ambiguus TaxID=176160 RepID=UPI003CCD9C8C
MWILDSEGSFLGGKRVWLRPGKKYLFGRTRQNGVQHAIEHTSISRKHMIIDVSPVKPGDGSHIYTKSELVISDQGSKCGTIVDGELLKNDSVRLTEDEHTIKLGKYKSALRIKWEPTVLTFSFSSKELKAKDPLANVRSRLEDLDIKTVIPYVVGQTTHVVQNKRNTAKGLQALVNGKPIVHESYLDALVYAATPGDLENLESLSPLEADFDSAWPDPREHLPPPGKELVQRPVEAFAPNPARVNVFDGYTFVFGDAAQCDNLRDPITNGHGKVLLYPIENGVTTAGEVVQFMRSAAVGKGLGSQREGRGGVVYVRYRAKGKFEDWSIALSTEVARGTGQRVIEQSEFLDAILGCDASPLCRALREEDSPEPDEARPVESATPASSANVEIVADSQPSQEAIQTSQSKSKGPRVRSFVSKMKNFDDGFDINAIPAFDPEADGEDTADAPPSMDVDAPAASSQSPNSVEEEDVVSSLLPGAAAMKRRRAETALREAEEPSTSRPKKEEARPAKRPKLGVLEAARQHREAEEDAERRRREEEAELQGSLREVEKLKGLAIVEEMEVYPRHQDDEERRWDERWNGRKNFKKFRRRDGANRPRHRIQTVIVPLEEATGKGLGQSSPERSSPAIRSPSRSSSRSGSRMESQPPSRSQSQSQASHSVSRTTSMRQKRIREERESDSDDELRFRFRRRR